MKCGDIQHVQGKVNGRNSFFSDLNLKGIDMLAHVGVDGRMSV